MSDVTGAADNQELTPRQREILKVLVQEYIGSAIPVGSGTVRLVGSLDVSSATIRNELVVLEELGYVVQPHTSAGRVPTVRGYRYFVEQLMEQVDLPVLEKRMIEHQFYQMRLSLDQWMKLTATVLAHASRAASLVTPPHAARSHVKHMELIAIRDVLCLMILVLQDSSIHEEILTLDEPIEQNRLSQLSNRYNAALANLSAQEIRTQEHPDLQNLAPWEGRVLTTVAHWMDQIDRNAIHEIYRDGLVNVLQQPEFGDADKFRQIMEILEHRSLLESILSRTLEGSGVQIIIGGEGDYGAMDDVSLVLSPYGVRNKASGVLGIIGPTRMSYGRAISTVRYVALLMDSLVGDLYG